MRSAIVKSRVRAGFDHGSRSYAASALFQDEMTREMIERLSSMDMRGSAAVELGCGVGKLVSDVTESGRFKTVTGVDMSFGMLSETKTRLLEAGQRARLVQADIDNLPIRYEAADLVFSNLVFHWLPELADGFREAARILKKGGVFIANILADGTFAEIREALNSALMREGKSPDPAIFHPFPPLGRIIGSAESAGLSVTESRAHDYARVFADPRSIMRALKSQGVQNGPGLASMGLGRRGVMELFDEEYRSRFTVSGGVRLTYQVVHITAMRA